MPQDKPASGGRRDSGTRTMETQSKKAKGGRKKDTGGTGGNEERGPGGQHAANRGRREGTIDSMIVDVNYVQE